ncbi:hypothetical protein [Vibrio chagasii]|uniref:hypothetical protein n=1 Tax=Vibrio chagasii TaxID=170679 RepID=UPI00228381F3|nr:hypothetical protein [Vibrio chagasii]MCY9828833.1 hypothetical protein [Vibrio chagasii]
MSRYFPALGVVVVLGLSGCASEPAYQGQGEAFRLASINLIERDLSLISPADVALTTASHPVNQGEVVPLTTFAVKKGESGERTLRRWFKSQGAQEIAWSMSAEYQALLNEPSTARQHFEGSLKKVIDEFTAERGVTLHYLEAEYQGRRVVGVYDFDGQARLTRVSGSSLKQVIGHVVTNYGFEWKSGEGNDRSWVSPKDYQFSADYYLLTPRDDIEGALTSVLEGYPVNARIVDSTNQVFVEGEY